LFTNKQTRGKRRAENSIVEALKKPKCGHVNATDLIVEPDNNSLPRCRARTESASSFSLPGTANEQYQSIAELQADPDESITGTLFDVASVLVRKYFPRLECRQDSMSRIQTQYETTLPQELMNIFDPALSPKMAWGRAFFGFFQRDRGQHAILDTRSETIVTYERRSTIN